MELYAGVMEAVREAGKMLLKGSKELNNTQIHAKTGPANFVTDYDTAIQRFLFASLSQLLPGCGFYGEEDTEGNTHKTDGYTFYIDPIDGTTNFLYGYNHSCVSVGLGKDGVIIAGWVYNPFSDEMYHAERGKGAWLNDKLLKIENKRLSEGIASFGCARYNDEDAEFQFEVIKQLFLRSVAIRCGGSAALDLCRVASGSNVTYFETLLQPYDYAAASVIIEEAGGVIKPFSLDKPCRIIAGTDRAVQEIREIVG